MELEILETFPLDLSNRRTLSIAPLLRVVNLDELRDEYSAVLIGRAPCLYDWNGQIVPNYDGLSEQIEAYTSSRRNPVGPRFYVWERMQVIANFKVSRDYTLTAERFARQLENLEKTAGELEYLYGNYILQHYITWYAHEGKHNYFKDFNYVRAAKDESIATLEVSIYVLCGRRVKKEIC